MITFGFIILTIMSCFSNLVAAPIERSYFDSVDGIELEGFFHKPSTISKVKGLVLVIGGSGLTKGGFGGPANLSQKLADSSYLSFEWNKRGLKTNSEYSEVSRSEDYQTADLGNIYKDAVSAMNHATSMYPHLDLFIVGGSEGSLIATLLAEEFPLKIKAVATFATVVSHFMDTITYQISEKYIKKLFIFDNDKDQKLSLSEIMSAMNNDKMLKSFFQRISKGIKDLDLVPDEKISKDEIRFVLGDILINNSPGYFMMTSGLPDIYLPSMFRILPLYNRIQNINIPIGFFQGEDDWNTPVDKLMNLDLITRALHMDNFSFKYYAGVGHKPSDELLNDVIKYFDNHR